MEILLVVFLWHLDESLLKCSLRLLHWSLYCHAPRCVVADKVARYCKKVMKNKGKKKIGYLMQYFQSFSEVPNFRHFFPIKLERAKWGVHMEMFLQLCVNDLSHQFIKFFLRLIECFLKLNADYFLFNSFQLNHIFKIKTFNINFKLHK